MKRCISIFMILLMGSSLLAFDKDDDWKSRRKRGFFRGGAGGFDVYMLPLKVGEVNTKLSDVIGIGEFNDNMFLTGGGGWGYVGKSIRIGGMGFGGFAVSEGAPDPGQIQKEITLSLSFGGFLIEKSFHPFNNSEIYFGTMIGGGSASLELIQWSGPSSWNDVWKGYSIDTIIDTTNNYYDYKTELQSEFFVLMPTIGFRYNIFRWCAIGANVGYLYTHMDQRGWKSEGRRISNVPKIDFSNTVYRFNVYFGG